MSKKVSFGHYIRSLTVDTDYLDDVRSAIRATPRIEMGDMGMGMGMGMGVAYFLMDLHTDTTQWLMCTPLDNQFDDVLMKAKLIDPAGGVTPAGAELAEYMIETISTERAEFIIELIVNENPSHGIGKMLENVWVMKKVAAMLNHGHIDHLINIVETPCGDFGGEYIFDLLNTTDLITVEQVANLKVMWELINARN